MRLMSATVAVAVPAMLVLSVCMFILAPSIPLEARTKAEADVLRLVPRVLLQREAELGRGAVEVCAAERVRSDRIARPDAADREAAQRIAADEEQVVQPERRSTSTVGEHPAHRAADRSDDVLENALVVNGVG